MSGLAPLQPATWLAAATMARHWPTVAATARLVLAPLPAASVVGGKVRAELP